MTVINDNQLIEKTLEWYLVWGEESIPESYRVDFHPAYPYMLFVCDSNVVRIPMEMYIDITTQAYTAYKETIERYETYLAEQGNNHE